MRPKETPYVSYMRMLSVGCLTNMTKILVVISKDCVMCSGRVSLEKHDEQAINTK